MIVLSFTDDLIQLLVRSKERRIVQSVLIGLISTTQRQLMGNVSRESNASLVLVDLQSSATYISSLSNLSRAAV